MPAHDNDDARQDPIPRSIDPHGQAALLLVESLIHALCESAMLSAMQAVEIAERAANVQAECAQAADGAGAPLWHSHALLSAIAASLKIDCRGTPTLPGLAT